MNVPPVIKYKNDPEFQKLYRNWLNKYSKGKENRYTVINRKPGWENAQIRVKRLNDDASKAMNAIQNFLARKKAEEEFHPSRLVFEASNLPVVSGRNKRTIGAPGEPSFLRLKRSWWSLGAKKVFRRAP